MSLEIKKLVMKASLDSLEDKRVQKYFRGYFHIGKVVTVELNNTWDAGFEDNDLKQLILRKVLKTLIVQIEHNICNNIIVNLYGIKLTNRDLWFVILNDNIINRLK